MEKTVEYYMSLPYTIELVPEPEGGWFVRVRELPGCMSTGDTPEEAVQMIREAMRLWIETSLEDGDPIPEPRPLEDYSGKFVVRIPRSLHQDLVEQAEREGVSLNQYVCYALARSVGHLAETRYPPAKPEWPGLKAAVRHALLAAGLAREAGELDEQLFAHHLEQNLRRLEEVLNQGYFLDALQILETSLRLLHPATGQSPLLEVFSHALTLLRDQVEVLARLQKGVLEELVPRSRISDFG